MTAYVTFGPPTSPLRETTSYLNVQVKDEGIGISDRDLQRIFEPFSMQFNSNARGNGVGLSICK